MPDLGLITTTIRRSRGLGPVMPLVNMFSERAITEPRQFNLLSFPGLTEQGSELGVGPVTALLQADRVLSGDIVAISSGGLYVDGASVGAVNGSSHASIAGNEIGAVATAGGAAAFYDGSDFSTVAFPDGRSVRKVLEQGGRFLFIPNDGQDWFWTQPYADAVDGSGEILIDALDYASAESEPDRLLDAVLVGDNPVLLGSKTIEFWAKTGDADLPYVPIEGRVFAKGVRATGCAAVFDNPLAWVSDENIVYRAGNVPDRISDAGIEEVIAASATCRVDSYFFEGHEFLKIGLDTVTVELDAQTGQWSERKTGIGNFLGGPVISGPVFGSAIDGRLFEFGQADDLGDYHEKSFCIAVSLDGGAVPIDNVRLRINPGATDYLSGAYANPAIELHQSYDWGQTFDLPVETDLGEQGEYRREVEWRALGLADPPGFFARIRVTDPVAVRVSGASFNEAHGGRSR